jgi:hypothetical protein
VNPEKTKYMLMWSYQKAGQSIAQMSFEDLAKFKYFEKNTNRLKLHSRRD